MGNECVIFLSGQIIIGRLTYDRIKNSKRSYFAEEVIDYFVKMIKDGEIDYGEVISKDKTIKDALDAKLNSNKE